MLHIVNRSPLMNNALQSCLRLAMAGSEVLLIEDGVYAAKSGTETETLVRNAMQTLTFYALEADLQARGLTPETLIDGIQLVDYGGFVDLVASNPVNQTWL